MKIEIVFQVAQFFVVTNICRGMLESTCTVLIARPPHHVFNKNQWETWPLVTSGYTEVRDTACFFKEGRFKIGAARRFYYLLGVCDAVGHVTSCDTISALTHFPARVIITDEERYVCKTPRGERGYRAGR